MNWIRILEDHPTSYGAIVALASLLFPQVRRWIGRLKKWIFKGRDKEREVQNQMFEKICFIEKELRLNGGSSLRDVVMIQVNRQKAQFWRSLRPSVEMTKDVQVELVSESACHLFGVADPQQLLSRNWLNFVAGRVDEFLLAFENATKFGSGVNFYLPLRSDDGGDRGTWELRLSPITPQNAPRPLYSGYFRPVCEVAKACLVA